jgi:UDP-2,4-diacetamido-2,4,6-trideoxy-beta-L-altropyranose hydrolase
MSAAGSHIAFLTEGGPAVGLGHVSRCLALARAADGARASFLVTEDAHVVPLLAGLADEVVCLPWRIDPSSGLRKLRELSPDVIVVDSYAASAELLASLRPVAPVVVVDDLADRRLPADVIVNGGAGAEGLPYERTPGTRLLLGPRYALLDPRYGETPVRPRATRVSRVLICLGGSRQVDATLAALGAVDRVFRDCVVDVAAGPFRAGSSSVDAAPGGARNRVVIRRDGFGLRDRMVDADVAISGGGVTLCELAATATPTVAVCLADNQRPHVDAFAGAGAALAVGTTDAPRLQEAIEAALRRLGADAALRAAMGARGRALVDGRGAARVAQAIMRPVEFCR